MLVLNLLHFEMLLCGDTNLRAIYLSYFSLLPLQSPLEAMQSSPEFHGLAVESHCLEN